jgi:spectinomycin phosphotransferase
LVPSYLAECGVPGIVAPLLTRTGSPVATIDRLHVSVQPWISGQMGAVAGLCPEQWRSFGELLARIHATELPARLREEVATEGYVPVAVAPARRLQRHLLHGQVDTADDLVRSLTEEWRAASGRIAVLIDAVERLAIVLRQRSPRTVLCHGDAHIANVLIDDDNKLWLLDWEEIIAPRERDLMFVVDGVLADTPVTPEQQSWFFDGYGAHEVDDVLLAYYRCDWALQDLTDFAARVLDPKQWSDDRRAEALRFFRSLLWPTGIVALALDAAAVL